MKNTILLLLLSIFLVSCEKEEETAKTMRLFRVDTAGDKYNFKISTRTTGTDKEIVYENLTGVVGPFKYEYTPEIGQTVKVTLSGAGLTSWRVTYKGEELMYSVAPGSGLAKDFDIKD